MSLEIVHGSIMRMVWTGETSVGIVRALSDYCQRCRDESPQLGRRVLVLSGEATGIPREARSEIIAFTRTKPWDRVAMIGNSFVVGVMIEVVTKALAGIGLPVAELGFFETEAEGLSWLGVSAPSSGPALTAMGDEPGGPRS